MRVTSNGSHLSTRSLIGENYLGRVKRGGLA